MCATKATEHLSHGERSNFARRFKYSLLQLLGAYPVLLQGGFGTMLALTSRAKARANHRNRFYLDTRLVMG